ncbi:MAG: hypothetical protein HN657_02015 [Candidatus Marinimicrobia bacterium]|jgi:hypothetical protein|nr:hypothetical protein [Candidatus Neomarinimicrobiota bacterium]MBT3495843.1 hypothetical protein [Candidatus Neomarinimicrobiota bacterium]MBT3692760.1 hypothetical protein [Candidatus Neomarinimicrobiota bacterium]MBT3731625.1 hypothetical protein [Candidatus Neomarinimicrobiota bacterium]MBT4145108.1 hypothetical protein [Candidatus Neomarinimicrobiota bacterium]
MQDHHTHEKGLKYKEDYLWPALDAKRNCPKCNEALERQEDEPTYFGKPWWCGKCQWQFSEEDLNSKK